MKAYHWMMALLLFNIVIAVFATLDIWDFGYNAYSYENIAVTIGTYTVVFVVALLATAALASYLFPAGERNTIYILFSGVYWALWQSTRSIFDSIFEDTGAGLILIGVFFGIAAILWLVGLSQMVTGGWASHE